MNKRECIKVSKARSYITHFEATQDAAVLGIAARTMGALIRACRSDKARRELMAIADELCVSGHSDFIVARWS